MKTEEALPPEVRLGASRRVCLWVALATVLASAAGCRSGEDTRLPTRTVSESVAGPATIVPEPTVAARGRGADAPGGPAIVEAPAVVTATFQAVPFPGDTGAWPGPWSPEGTHLIALAPDEVPDPSGAEPIARVWTLAVDEAAPSWDSGDVGEPISRARDAAAWRADGTLVLARSHDAVVGADGTSVAGVQRATGQPRQVSVSPAGLEAFLEGPDGSWLLGPDGAMRPVIGRPAAGFDGWSWRPDGAALALSGGDGGLYVLDVAAAEAKLEVRTSAPRPEGGYAAPAWLPGDRVLLTDPIAYDTGEGPGYDLAIVELEPEGTKSLARTLGLPPNPAMPPEPERWVAPGGAALLFPEVHRMGGDEYAARWWLYRPEQEGGDLVEAPPMMEPAWDPTGRRVAYRDADGGLSIWQPDTQTVRPLPLGGEAYATHAWSGSGRWLAVVDRSGGLWLAATDVAAGPSRVADSVDARVPPTFAPDDTMLAVTLLDEDASRQLAIGSFGIERP